MASIINSEEEFDDLMTKLNNLTVIDNLETEDADNPLSAKQGKVLKTLIDTIALTIYPVGSIYMTVNNVNPSALFGGTWVRWGDGRVPVGVDTTQTEFNEVEKTGGYKTHTLTIEEVPSHNHSTDVPLAGKDMTKGWTSGTNGSGYNPPTITATIRNTGGGQAHNNLQPYITCYIWKRTA